MDQRRIAFDDRLHTAFDNLAHIYYQPPESVRMEYPAIRYRRSYVDITHADNVPYLHDYSFEVTVIDRNPDSVITAALLKFPRCRYNRTYVSENLYHDVLTIYN